MGDCKFYHVAGYFIPEEHAKEYHNIVSNNQFEEGYETFSVDGFNPEQPVVVMRKNYYEAELKGITEAKSQLNEEWEWVEPEFPQEMNDFLRRHAKYGLIEIYHWY